MTGLRFILLPLPCCVSHDDEASIAYAQPIVAELRANRVRADSEFRATSFRTKIASSAVRWDEAARSGLAGTLAPPARDLGAGALSVCLHHGGPQGAKPQAEVIADILPSIRERRA